MIGEHFPLAELVGIVLTGAAVLAAILIARRMRIKFLPPGEHDPERTRTGIRSRLLGAALWALCLMLVIFGVKAILANPHWPSPGWLIVSVLLAAAVVFRSNLRLTGNKLWDALLLGAGVTGLGVVMALGLPGFFWAVLWPLLKWALILGLALFLLTGFVRDARGSKRG